MARYATAVSFLCLALAMVGCELFQTKTSDDDLQTIDTVQLKAYLGDDKKQTVVIDVRSPARFAASHIPGSINIHLPEVQAADPRLAYATTIISTSGDFGDYLAVAGAKKLNRLGYRNVMVYRGGVAQWTSEGNSAEKASATTVPAE